MNKNILSISVIILCFYTTKGVRADCNNGDLSCGENCCVKITMDDNKKHADIYKDYSASNEDNISILFGYLDGQNLDSITMPDSVTYIEYEALSDQNLKSIEIPPNAIIDSGALPSTINEIIIPDNMSAQIINNWYEPFYHFRDNDNVTFRCKGNVELCRTTFAKYIVDDDGNCEARSGDSEGTACFNFLNFQPALKEQCTGSNYYWSGTSCNNNKNGIKCSNGYSLDDDDICIICNKQGYKNVYGYCNRIRYTPAEAAEVLHDDNTNEVTITFRK